MKTALLRTLGSMVFLLCLGLWAHGQTITGTNPVCKGNPGNYTVSGAPAGTHFVWLPPSGGALTGSNTTPSVSVLWGVAGSTSVSVQVYDALNNLLTTVNYPVTVAAIPTPTISTDAIVGCHVWEDSIKHGEPNGGGQPGPGNPSILDDAQGCVKVCEYSNVTYTAAGTPGSTYTWTVGGGTPATAIGPSVVVTWGAAGPGSITVTETTTDGCVGTKEICVEKIVKPKAYFDESINPGATVITTCLNYTLYFIDGSIGSPSSPIVEWFWDFGDGATLTSLTSTTVSHAYTAPGLYNVTLTVKNACNCVDKYRIRVRVLNRDGVKIVCPSVVCEGATAKYSLNPDPGCSTYNWSQSGGTVVGSSTGPTFEVQWDNVGPSGFGYVTFDPTGCGVPCPAPTTIKVPVIQSKGTIAGPSVLCPNTQYLFNMPQWPTTVFNWSIVTSSAGATLVPTDQNNQIALNTGGSESFELVCDYYNTLLGCGGQARMHIDVLPPDSIVGPKTVCFNSGSTNFSLFSGVTGDWTLTYPDLTTQTWPGVNAIAPFFSQTGNYTLSVTGGFCPPKPLNIRVNPLPPVPDSLVGPAVSCFGSPTLYTAGGPLPGTIFSWYAVTGSVSPASNSSTTYATFTGGSPATIGVFRITTDEAHCYSDSLEMLVYRPTVTAVISGPDTVCPSTAYTFTSGYSAGEVYGWTVSNTSYASVAGGANLENASVMFNGTSGVPVTIYLKIRKCGADTIITKTVWIRSVTPPAISVSPSTTLCRDQPFTVSVGIPATSYDWDWDDGTAHGTTDPAGHVYNTLAPGSLNYNITVIIDSPFGCPTTVTATQSVSVLPAPVANVTPPGPFHICSGTPNQLLTATLQNGYEHTNTLQWWTAGSLSPFNSCTASSSTLPPTCVTHTATALGGYFVVAIGDNGCADTSNVVVFDNAGCGPGPGGPCTLTPNPTVSVTATEQCGQVHINGTYTGPPPTAVGWGWNDPLVAQNVATTNTTYDGFIPVAGIYPFTYSVTFNDGTNTCVRTATADVLVRLVPDMGYTVSCDPGGNGYVVTLQDHSNYFPGYQPVGYTFWINGVPHVSASSSYTTVLPFGGAFGFKTVTHFPQFGPSATLTDSCQSFDSLYTPNAPVASFLADSLYTCAEDKAVQFTNLSTGGAPLMYAWDFNGIPNTAQNPFTMFMTPGLPPVTLEVTDLYGCKDDTTVVINVQPDDFNGNITATPNTVCAGNPVTLAYGLIGGSYPASYYWYEDDDLLYGPTSASSTTVFTPGSYWLIGTNAIGCRIETPREVVNVNQPPAAVINGDSTACLEQPYTLYGYAGNDPGISYTWTKVGFGIVGTGDSYTDPAVTAGTFTYTLQITSTQFGITCTSTSAPFVVTVNPPPPPPSVTFNVLDCNSYLVELTASSSVTSPWYNWSHGAVGNPAYANGGGPYRVWLTDQNGCRSYADADVPKDPRAYLWIFPTGCYNFCWQQLPKTLVGPIQPFEYWAWWRNGGPDVVNPITPTPYPVSNYSINGPGFYNLELQNAFCGAISDPMEVSVEDCAPCDRLRFYDKGYKEVSCGPGCCTYDIDFMFDNFDGIPIGVNITSSIGYMMPGSALAMPGSNLFTLSFIPPPYFAGGNVTFTMTYTDREGRLRTCTYTMKLPACSSKRPADGMVASTPDAAGTVGSAALNVVPNPANNSTRIDYTLTSGVTAASLEVYDMTGRLMTRTMVDKQTGSWTLPLAEYVPGIYTVVLREAGGAMKVQQRLTVVH